MKVSTLRAQASPGDVWAAGDFDAKCVSDVTLEGNAYSSGGIASGPVHSSVRSFLYFDMHVATCKAGQADTYPQ